MKKKSNVKISSDRLFNFVNNSIMLLVVLVTLYPMWYVLVLSLSNLNMVSTNEIWILPKFFTLINYQKVFEEPALLPSFRMTVFRTLCGAALHVFVCSLAAYSLSKPFLIGRKFFTVVVLVTMYVSGGLVPWFLALLNLKLLNNPLAYIVPGIYPPTAIAIAVLVMRSFFAAIPGSLEESARIDGASDPVVFSRIVLPLSKPVLATMFLFNAVYHWNDWFIGEMIMKEKRRPLATLLMHVLVKADQNVQGAVTSESLPAIMAPTPEGIRLAMILVSTAPILLIYPFLQKYFAKGIMIGSIKG